MEQHLSIEQQKKVNSFTEFLVNYCINLYVELSYKQVLHIFIGSFCILFFFWKIVLLRVKMDCKNKLFDTSVLRFTTKCLVNSHGTFFRKEQMEIFSQNLLPYLRNLLPYLKRTLSTSFWVAVTYVLIENS